MLVCSGQLDPCFSNWCDGGPSHCSTHCSPVNKTFVTLIQKRKNYQTNLTSAVYCEQRLTRENRVLCGKRTATGMQKQNFRSGIVIIRPEQAGYGHPI